MTKRSVNQMTKRSARQRITRRWMNVMAALWALVILFALAVGGCATEVGNAQVATATPPPPKKADEMNVRKRPANRPPNKKKGHKHSVASHMRIDSI